MKIFDYKKTEGVKNSCLTPSLFKEVIEVKKKIVLRSLNFPLHVPPRSTSWRYLVLSVFITENAALIASSLLPGVGVVAAVS